MIPYEHNIYRVLNQEFDNHNSNIILASGPHMQLLPVRLTLWIPTFLFVKLVCGGLIQIISKAISTPIKYLPSLTHLTDGDMKAQKYKIKFIDTKSTTLIKVDWKIFIIIFKE